MGDDRGTVEENPGGTVFATVLTDDYIPGFAVLLHTLQKHQPDFAFRFHVFYREKQSPLSPRGRALVTRLYPQAVLTELEATKHSEPEALFCEALKLAKKRRVIVLHADLMCLGDIGELLSTTAEVAVVPNLKTEASFGTGVLVLNDPAWIDELLSQWREEAGFPFREFLIQSLSARNPYRLTPLLGASKRSYEDRDIDGIDALVAEGVRLIHFEGDKPWHAHGSLPEARFQVLESAWAKELRESLLPIANDSRAGEAGECARSILSAPRFEPMKQRTDLAQQLELAERRTALATEKQAFAVELLRRGSSPEAAQAFPVSDHLTEEITRVETLLTGERDRCRILEKENAALERTLRVLKDKQTVLEERLKRLRSAESQNKAIQKAALALSAYAVKVSDRLEKLASNPLLFFFKKRFLNWSASLRKRVSGLQEVQPKPNVKSKS